MAWPCLPLMLMAEFIRDPFSPERHSSEGQRGAREGGRGAKGSGGVEWRVKGRGRMAQLPRERSQVSQVKSSPSGGQWASAVEDTPWPWRWRVSHNEGWRGGYDCTPHLHIWIPGNGKSKFVLISGGLGCEVLIAECVSNRSVCFPHLGRGLKFHSKTNPHLPHGVPFQQTR